MRALSLHPRNPARGLRATRARRRLRWPGRSLQVLAAALAAGLILAGLAVYVARPEGRALLQSAVGEVCAALRDPAACAG